MTKVTMIGSITCQDDRGDDCEAVLVRMVDAARDEPGVEVYSYHRSDDTTCWLFALMAGEQAMQNHGRTGAMQEAMADMGPLLATPPMMTPCRPVAAVGLDL